MRTFGVLVCVVLAVPRALLAAEASVDAERVYARAAVPDEERKVGEVRLIERNGMVVVDTLLVTRLIERVAAEIRHKEEQSWPPDSAERPAMESYTAALAAAAAKLRSEIPPADARNIDDSERRVHLLIEFRADATRAEVELAQFDSVGPDAVFEAQSRRSLATLTLDRGYVLRNMRLIIADAFHIPEREVTSLGPLGPAAPP